jgi:hypothetical protein
MSADKSDYWKRGQTMLKLDEGMVGGQHLGPSPPNFDLSRILYKYSNTARMHLYNIYTETTEKRERINYILLLHIIRE